MLLQCPECTAKLKKRAETSILCDFQFFYLILVLSFKNANENSYNKLFQKWEIRENRENLRT